MIISISEAINNLILPKNLIIIFTIILVPYLVIIINKYCYKYNIVDIPNKRKSHKLPMPISGGIVLLTSLILITIFMNIFNLSYDFFLNIFFFSFIFFVLGLMDDLKKFDTRLKIILIIILIFLILIFFNELNLKYLRFNFLFNKVFVLEYLSIPFTIFCIFMLFNALNYADGKNGISISLSIFWIAYLILSANVGKFVLLETLLVLFVLLIFNLKNKLFLGNSGVNFLSIFISLSLIKIYNFNLTNLYCDEIFLLLYIPGLDAARVTILRIYKKSSPLSPDKNHLHHHLEKYIKEKYIWFIYLMLSITPILLLLNSNNFIISISIPSLIYFVLITNFIKKLFIARN